MDASEIPIEAYFRRQMTAIGVNAMEQISLMHVLVVGLRGCGMEIAKCLALSGVQRLTLMDDELVREEDLAVGFLLRDGDQGKAKAKLVASRLNELAPFADVRTLNGSLSLDLLLNFHVVVFASVSVSQEEVIAYDEFCRSQDPPIGVVVAESRGLFGSVFTDFSVYHQSMSTTPGIGDAAFSVIHRRTQIHDDDRIDTISVTVKEPLVRMYLEPGDHVTLHTSNMEREPLLLAVEKTLSDDSVRLRPIDSTRRRKETQMRLRDVFTRLQRVGSQVFTVTHRSLRESLLLPGSIATPTSLTSGEINKERCRSLHVASLAVHQFRREFGILPNSNSVDHIEHMVALIEKLLDKNKSCQCTDTTAPRMYRTDEVDLEVAAQALRCASSELLALSALIAGHAALQVLKYSGALGPLLHPDSQFMYFDILDLVRDVSSDVCSRDSALSTMFGSDWHTQLRNATVAVVGIGSVNLEVLKNLMCSGIGSDRIHVILDPDENSLVQAEDLSSRVVFSPASVGVSKVSALKAFRSAFISGESVSEELRVVPWETWTASKAVVAEVSSVRSRLAVDDGCRVYEKPTIFVHEDACGARRTRTVVPEATGTFSERLLAPRHKSQPDIFPFDHIPTPSKSLHGDPDPRVLLPLEQVVQEARYCFEAIFQRAIQVTTRYFENDLSSKTMPGADHGLYDEEETMWIVWSVIQRGHGVDDFKDCLRVAWVLLELLPLWMDKTKKNDRTARPETTADDERRSDQNEDERQTHNATKLLQLDANDPDQVQLLVATACIVAASVRVAIPPVESRRVLLAQVSHDARGFSLHHNPRTSDSIREGFGATDTSHLLSITGRVQSTALDLDDVSKGHLHFLQSLANVQLTWSKQCSPRIATLPQVRRLCREKREFLPITTILGALTTLQLIQVLLGGTGRHLPNETLREYAATTTAPGRRALQLVALPPLALISKSMPHEVTRGTSLRLIPDELSRWSKIVVPVSAALQSAKAIVQFVEAKFQVTVHAIHYHERCVATVNSHAMAAPDGPLTHSVFDLCGSSAPLVVLDLVAVDARGDVVLAPLRIQRKV